MRIKSKLLTIILVILLIIIIALGAIIFTSPAFKDTQVYKYISNLFPKANAQMKLKVLDPNIKGAADYGLCKDTIIIAQGQGVYAMNQKGDWLWDRKVNLQKPLIKVAKNYFVVADLEGQAVLLYKDNNFVWQRDFSKGVINVDLTEDGIVTVVHNEDGYSAAVSVMKNEGDVNGKGIVKFTRKINDNYVISAVSSSEQNQVCINSFSTNGGVIKGSINFLRISDGQSFTSKIIDGQIFNMTLYLNNSVLAVNSDIIMKYNIKESGEKDQEKEIIWEKSSNTGQLLAANTIENKHLIIAVGSGNNGVFSTSGDSGIFVYNQNGKEVTNFKVNGTVRSISQGPKKVFAIYTNNEVYIYNVNGDLLYKHNTMSEIERVYFLNNKEIIVFTKKDIHILTEEVNEK